jgi:hypothetical protein
MTKIDTMNSPIYLTFIRTQLCSFCGRNPCDAHHAIKHFRSISGGGIGLKGSDFLSIPACRKCHGELHRGSLKIDRQELLELIIVNLVGFLANIINRAHPSREKT